MSDDDTLTMLARFYDPSLGHIAKSVLESHDIPCFIFDAEHTAVPWDIGLSMGATRLMVLQSDFEEGLKILKDEKIGHE